MHSYRRIDFVKDKTFDEANHAHPPLLFEIQWYDQDGMKAETIAGQDIGKDLITDHGGTLWVLFEKIHCFSKSPNAGLSSQWHVVDPKTLGLNSQALGSGVRDEADREPQGVNFGHPMGHLIAEVSSLPTE